jgi:hypothetical protein
LVFVVASRQYHFCARQTTEQQGTLGFGQFVVLVIGVINEIADRRDNLGRVSLDRFAQLFVQRPALMQVGDSENFDLSCH